MSSRPPLSPLHRPPAWADRYVGIPWMEEGRTKQGWDCWGCIRVVASEQFGIAVPVYDQAAWRRLGNRSEQERANEELKAFMTHQRERDWRPLWEAATAPKDEVLGGGRVAAGDFILMRGEPFHVGIVVAPGWMLHVEEGLETLCQPYDDGRWEKRVIGFYRYGAARC